MMMTEGDPFIDYYDVLQVDWECDAKELEFAYRHLAKLYHPDHPETADVTKFNEVIEAYRGLRNPDQRAEYDTQYATKTHKRRSKRLTDDESHADEKNAIGDAEIHEITLRYLYKRRREHANDAGVGPFLLQEMLNCSDEHFDFHIWYLKAKGLIQSTEQGTLAITIEGVDHVIAMSRTNKAERLRIAQSTDPQD